MNNCQPTADPISLANKDRKANIFFKLKHIKKVTWADLGLEFVSIKDFFKINGSHALHVKIQPKHEIRLYKRYFIDTDSKPRSAQFTF